MSDTPRTPSGPDQLTVGVMGLGYLGAVHTACMAALGHTVIGYDIDARKVDALRTAEAPFFEPGLEDMLARTHGDNLLFTKDVVDLKSCDVVFIGVGTPQQEGETTADTSYVFAAIDAVAEILDGPTVIVGKSTVPVGTSVLIDARLAEIAPDKDIEVAWNPEFLREGHAVDDTLTPDRLVFGVSSPRAEDMLHRVYATPLAAGTPLIVTDRPTAELVKVAANSFLATKISFINAMAELCEVGGGDVGALADAIGYDDRIGRKFLNAGLGFGGGCLPKDIRAFIARAHELDADKALVFLRAIDDVNLRQRSRVVEMVRTACGGSFIGKRVAFLGMTFKPDTDDIRDSPALNVAGQVNLQGASIVVTDPEGLDNVRRLLSTIHTAPTALEACVKADVVVLGTEWQCYVDLDPVELGTVVRNKHIVDGRNVLDPARWRKAGWTYRGIGRP